MRPIGLIIGRIVTNVIRAKERRTGERIRRPAPRPQPGR